MSHPSAQIEDKSFTEPFAPATDQYLVFHSDDGFKLTVKVGGETVYTFNRFNNLQQAPNVEGNLLATKFLHRMPSAFQEGVASTLRIDYRNKIYMGAFRVLGRAG